MKPSQKVLLLATAAVAVGALAILFTKKRKAENRLAEVADEGYELAHDVLYPLKEQRRKHDGYTPAF